MKKLFQNKSLLKSIQIFLVCLVVLGGGLGNAKNVEAAHNDILIYYTDNSLTPGTCNLDLIALGFIPHTKIRNGAGELTNGAINLSDYGQVWIIDTSGGAFFTGGEISAIKTFRDNGGGLLLSADHFGCQERVNPITSEFNNGVEMFYGEQKTGGSCVNPIFTVHPLNAGLSKMSSTDSDACFDIQNTNIEIIIRDEDLVGDITDSCDGDNEDDIYGAVLDECGKGRIIFDSSVNRFLAGSFVHPNCHILGFPAETCQYHQNIAKWLDVCVPCPLPTCTLTADPTSIDPLESSNLKWTTENTDSADINGVAVNGASLPDGNKSVSPDLATTYKMTVVNTAGDTGFCSAMVGVKVPPDTTGGLVPCGRLMDDCDTDWDERADCNLCHFIIMGKLIIDFLIKIAVVVGALFIALGGILYILAAGDTGKMALAKGTISRCLLGFAIIFTGWLIVNTIMVVFGYADLLDSGGKWHKITCNVPMRNCASVPPAVKICGDGNVDTPNTAGFNEECDTDGSSCGSLVCLGNCTCKAATYCGDGNVDKPNDAGFDEECDIDGSSCDSLVCNADCTCKTEPTPGVCGVWVTGAVAGSPFVIGTWQTPFNITDKNFGLLSADWIASGNYPDNFMVFPNARSTSFDGIAIDKNTRLEMWDGKDYTGNKIIDATGPTIINNKIHAGLYVGSYTVTNCFGLNKTYWTNCQLSTEDIRPLGKGSSKITCTAP